MPAATTINPIPGLPNSIPGSNQTYNTGIPGFDVLSQAASQNVSDLLRGVESPAITQNMNAMWGAGAGVPGSEFLRNRAVDLYGQRSQARKQQGLSDLLNMMQGYSGTVTARPADILGQQTAFAQMGNAANIAAADRAQRAQEAQMNAALQAAQLGLTGGTNLLNTYLNFLK